MKTVLLCAATLALVMLLTTVQGQDYGRGAPVEQRVDQLASQVASLTARITRLEHADGSQEATRSAMASAAGAAAPTTAAPVPTHGGRYITVDNIQTGPAGSDNSQQITQLQAEINQLQSTVTKQRAQLAQGKGGGGRGISGTRPGGEGRGGQFGDPMSGVGDVVGMYASQLGVKRRKLEALQQQATEGSQIIHGHEGDVIVTLQTSGDLSADLDNVQIGDAISWTGRRVSADGKSESWMINTVRKLPSSGS